MLTLILGGTRSGKSARGEQLAAATGLAVRYVATADARDASMQTRIAAHRARRPADWETVEATDMAAAVGAGACVLVDALGPWLGALLHRGEGRDAALAGADAMIAVAAEREVIVVAEEAGQGLLPADALSRTWLDLLGEVVQRLSTAAQHVELVVAGRPLALTTPAPPPRVHGDQLVREGDADHAVNVLAGGPPTWLQEAIAAADVTRYPDERAASAALAALHGRDPAEIVPVNGAAQALWLLPAALRPALAACVHPAFSEGEAALRAHGVAVQRLLRRPEDGFGLDPSAVPAAADLVIVGNPASPSGTLDPAAAIRALRRPGRTVVVDEAFMDLVPGEPESLVRERLDDVIVLRSLTKAFAIPGLRAGYAVAAPALAERLRAVRPPWSVNAPALAALTAVAQRPESLALNARRAQRERLDLEQRLADAGIPYWPAFANYVLIEDADAAARLRAAGIAVRPAGDFPGLADHHVRITARSAAENARLVEVLAA